MIKPPFHKIFQPIKGLKEDVIDTVEVATRGCLPPEFDMFHQTIDGLNIYSLKNRTHWRVRISCGTIISEVYDAITDGTYGEGFLRDLFLRV